MKPAPGRSPAAISPARAVAFELLMRIGTGSAHSDDLLHGPSLAALSQVDRDLVTALVLGVLRWQIALDARVRPLLSRPDMQLAEPVAVVLRMGAFQLLHMDRIPAHAALNESVELVRAAGQAHAAGMVNAILRKLVGVPAPRRPLVEPLEAMAERLGHPHWLVRRWMDAYGRGAAEAICGFDQQEPGCGNLFTDAEAPVMDAGSRLVAELAAASLPTAGRVWDCCAAPGGKTLVLGRRLPKARLLATDLSPKRLRRLEERLRRELAGGAEVEVRQADAAALPASAGEFDLILCDVPCSGTGTLARNPEIRHRLVPADLGRQAARQEMLLGGALQRLAAGGRLVYSTCSLEPEENERVVQAVLERLPGSFAVQRVPVGPLLEDMSARQVIRAEAGELSRIVRGDSLRTLPGFGFEGDGFFAAVVERM